MSTFRFFLLKGMVLKCFNTTNVFLFAQVSDNGCGFEKDKKDLLFKPFSQLSSHYARR